MAKQADIVKKGFERVDELREINAAVERAKTLHDYWLKRGEERRQDFEEREKFLSGWASELESKAHLIEDSVNRVQVKFELSEDEMNKRIHDKIDTLNHIQSAIDNAKVQSEKEQAHAHQIGRNLKRLLEQQDELFGVIKTQRDENEALSKHKLYLKQKIEDSKELLEKTIKEIKVYEFRKIDLDIYARRIQKYYDEAGLKIKI